MRIHHLFPNTHSRADVQGDRAFLLHQPTGAWFYNFPTPQTRYEGWYIPYQSAFLKLLSRIQPLDSLSATGLTHTLHDITWEYEHNNPVSYTLTEQGWGLHIANPKGLRLGLNLDIRHIYQIPEFDRTYTLSPEANGVMVKYTDPIVKQPVYVHVKANRPLTMRQDWQEESYPRDSARHSFPNHIFTYLLAETTANFIFFGAGFTEDEARHASFVASRTAIPTLPVGLTHSHHHLINEITTASYSVERSLGYLNTPQGLYAGLPWFHQIWSRDELIAALGLPPELQLRIIQKYLEMTLQHGELPTFINSGSTCADGVGWLALLIREYGTNRLTDRIKTSVVQFFDKARTQLIKDRMSGFGFIQSGHNATWMDTIGRSGYRLDIQCMYGLVLELLTTLTGDQQYEQERTSLLARIRNHFLYSGYLRDGLNDTTKRPNVFIAYLLQPDLLTEKLWFGCFDTVLESLKTSWGGLSSVDQGLPVFQRSSTGEDNKSYHNGDSWFFVNNLAAVAMHRLNSKRYNKEVMDIVQSSTHEILWDHMVGMPGEIASAEDGESWGCGIQAFSGGTYLMLLNELDDYSAGQTRDSMAAFWDSAASSKSETFFK